MSELQATIPKGSWILITGANGFLASQIVKQFLERGYKVRGTVRSLAKSAWLVQDVFQSYAQTGYFELVEVPDLGVEHAFDDSVKGVSAIVHVASIYPDPNPNNVIPKVVMGITSLLEAALKEPSVKRFVYTSSISAVTIPVAENATHIGPDTWNDAAVQLAWAPPPYGPSQPFIVYMASKTEAEKAIFKFAEEKAPGFSVNSVIPVGIVGEFLSKTHTESAYAWLKTILDGNKELLAGSPATINSDVKDCAVLHVAAVLDPEVKGTRLPVWGAYCNWNDMLAIMRKLYPEREFIDDLPGLSKLQLTVDDSQALGLLEKWGGQKGWKPLEQTVAEGMENLLKWYP